MNIDLTLFGQIITFVLFVWFTMKLVWPPILNALRERQKRIADGLAAADRGVMELEMARKKAKELIQVARGEASIIIERANVRAHQIEEEAQVEARNLAERMKRSAKTEIQRMEMELRQKLSAELSGLVLRGAEALVQEKISEPLNQHLFEELKKELEEVQGE